MCARGGTVQQLRVKAQLLQNAMQINFLRAIRTDTKPTSLIVLSMRDAKSAHLAFELVIAASALAMLLVAQWMLSMAIHGTNYYGLDGKMVQATVLDALKFGGLFDVTNLNPVAGIGSQMLTK